MQGVKSEFYKTCESQELKTKFKKIGKDFLFTKYMITTFLFSFSIILSFLNVWFLLGIIPSFFVPVCCAIANYTKRKNLIESINPKIKYQDYLEMKENGEWTKLSYENSMATMKNYHYVEENNSYIIADLSKSEENHKNNIKGKKEDEEISDEDIEKYVF